MGLMEDPGLEAAIPATQRWTAERVLWVGRWTPTLLSFRTSRAPQFRFSPGHYARLGLPAADGEDVVWRPYSVVSASYDDYLEFFAVRVPDGAFSAAMEKLTAGDTL